MTYTAIRDNARPDKRARGSWKPFMLTEPMRMSASFICPSCGAHAILEDHEIRVGGVVDPSVACECGWHESVTLDGWPPTDLRVYDS